ncbi:hypothetical protein NLI96_g10675 [Meripilus lineatus]|uniref:Uncharacterized protein n=1 Tax=Meripilus lineatus TaxID=2056292 RepID=A0AAD5UUU7_9APHY|nr:hypothetical protein NLI96_g10675 [Physisporinus lineatus]
MNTVQIVADLVTIILTVKRTRIHFKENMNLQNNAQGSSFTMTTFLAQDGTFYIVILLLINVAQTTTILITKLDFMFTISWMVSCVLQCTWILELRQVHFQEKEDGSSGVVSTVRFANRLLGNIGAPVRPLGSNTSDSLEDECIIFSEDPLSVMAVPETSEDRCDEYTDRDSIDVKMDGLFEDEEYGKRLLGLMRRGTSDSVEYHAVSQITDTEKEVRSKERFTNENRV